MAVSTLGEKKKESALPGVFALFVPSTDWMMPTHHDQGRSFSLSPVQMLIFSGPHRHTQKSCSTMDIPELSHADTEN